jgi:iron complex outermembrane receptor protein
MKRTRTRSELCVAVATAIGAGITLTAVSSASWAQQVAQSRERIEVTGTNIKRVDTETVAPVEIITRDQIERSGQATVGEMLRRIPSATAGSFNESSTNSFAPGAFGISLRGLGQKTTLVLLNGRRTASYGFAQNLQDTFVDINSIPTAAVERIEILKDGASAVYGSDAIAGVVNIILRKDFKGVEVNGYAGRFQSDSKKNDARVAASAGVGDLARDGYNVFGTFDWYRREGLQQGDTEFISTRDFRDRPGGRNFQSLTGGGTWRQLTATNTLTPAGVPHVDRAITDCALRAPTQRVITTDDALALGLISPRVPSLPNGSNPDFNLPGNTFCSRDFKDIFTILPKTEREGFLGRATKQFGSNMTAYVDLGLSRVKTWQTFQEPFFAGTTALQNIPGVGLRPFTYNINFAPGVAGNPFTAGARYQGVLNDMGTRDTDIKSDTTRLLGGLTYIIGKWDLDSAIGWSRNKVESLFINRTTLSGTSALFNVPTTPQPPVPLSTSATYNLDRWSTNTQAARDTMRAIFPRKSTSDLKFGDTKGSTEIGQLPGGPIGLAVGAEYRRESLQDRPDPIASSGDILGQGITATDASRNSGAFYAEASLPILRNVEASLAARYDHYSDYGNSTTPKIGIKWTPTREWLFRANWGKGFRAPTLPEISPSVATFFSSVIDPRTGNAVQVSGVFAGNPSLQAEKSTSFTAGVVFEPNQTFSAGVNFYHIDWKNIVVAQSLQTIVNIGNACGAIPQPPCVVRDPTSGNIVTVISNYINVNETKTKGYDFEGRITTPSPYGRFVTRLNVSYVDSFKEDLNCIALGICSFGGLTEVVGTNYGTNTIPRIRGNIAVDWDYTRYSATAQLNYIHHYSECISMEVRDCTISQTFFRQQDPRFQNGVMGDVHSYTTLDLYGRIKFTKNFEVSATILNVADRMPPYDPAGANFFLASIYDVRGRQYRIGLTWRM